MNSLYLTSRREEYKKEKKTKEKGTILVTNNPTPELYDPRIWSQAAPSWEPALHGGIFTQISLSMPRGCGRRTRLRR